jgi:PST family polysaccharide transporter
VSQQSSTPEPENLTRTTIRGTFWSYVAFYSGKAMVFVSTIILARLLAKDDFGVAGYALILIGMLEIFNQFGIGASVIYHRDDPDAPDVAFWLGLAIGCTLFVLTWLGAPLTALLFQDDRAVAVTRVLALVFPIGALGHVHNAVLRKTLAFDRAFIPDVARALSKGVLSIGLALLNFGAWSLIIGQLGSVVIWVVVLWWILPWRPSLRFHWQQARSILSYGVGSATLDIIAYVQDNSDYILIGRFLGAAALGVYTVAFRIPELLIIQFCVVIARVIFPVYTHVRDDAEALRQGFLATTRYVSLLTMPMALGMMLVARPFVLTVFTERWAEAIPVLQAIAMYTLMVSLAFNAGDIYKAQGRLGILTRIVIIEVTILLPSLYWAATRIGTIEAVAWTHVVVALFNSTLHMTVACHIIKTPFRSVLVALQPAMVGSAVMVLPVLGALSMTAQVPVVVQLVVAVLVGIGVYGGTLWLLQRSLMLNIWNNLRLAIVKR